MPHSLDQPGKFCFLSKYLMYINEALHNHPCSFADSPAAGGFLWKFSVPKMFMLIWFVYVSNQVFLRPWTISLLRKIRHLVTENFHRTSPAEGLWVPPEFATQQTQTQVPFNISCWSWTPPDYWQTHRDLGLHSMWHGQTVPKLHVEHPQMDRRTDTTKCIISLALRSIIM